MKLIKPEVRFEQSIDYRIGLTLLEQAARTCYRGLDRITANSAESLIRTCISKGHESVLEHINVGLRIICDRGVTHELVRHRVGVAYSQESTRYVNMKGEIEFIEPWWYKDKEHLRESFLVACEAAETMYNKLLDSGATPQMARAVLPNAVKTEIVVTANFRAWRHIFKLRRDKAAHPDMRVVMDRAFALLSQRYPVIFEDLKDTQEPMCPEEKQHWMDKLQRWLGN